MNRPIYSSLVAMVVAGGFFSFAAAQDAATPAGAPEAISSSSASTAITNSMSALDDKRKLSVGDRLSFRVVEDKKPPVMMVVTDSGEVEVPLIGRVMALNKTCKQLAEDIKSPLEKDYFYKATVIVGLDFSSVKSPGRVYVTGNVRTAGPLEIPPDENLTVSRAILRAGGFDQFANRHKVKLIRKKTGTPTGTETTVIDVGDIIDKGQTQKDMAVEPDDMIVVPRAFVNF